MYQRASKHGFTSWTAATGVLYVHIYDCSMKYAHRESYPVRCAPPSKIINLSSPYDPPDRLPRTWVRSQGTQGVSEDCHGVGHGTESARERSAEYCHVAVTLNLPVIHPLPAGITATLIMPFYKKIELWILSWDFDYPVCFSSRHDVPLYRYYLWWNRWDRDVNSPWSKELHTT